MHLTSQLTNSSTTFHSDKNWSNTASPHTLLLSFLSKHYFYSIVFVCVHACAHVPANVYMCAEARRQPLNVFSTTLYFTLSLVVETGSLSEPRV